MSARAAGAAPTQSTAEAASAAALRRTFMAGRVPLVQGDRRQAHAGTGLRLRLPRRCRPPEAPAARAAHLRYGASRLPAARSAGRVTVAGQRRIRTGFPPY
ncbi:hypothetical protein Sros01_83340 [Streptomyces roseochromogenus]|nr:hypothetical protein Slala05_08710 [Streptomyces lavendulae subsp. lavendulae]GLX42262.1 hypothetical protein Sros01_83340 [Streptomyces roseochromogenus]